MKITHVMTTTFGGAAKAALRLNEGLRSHGIESNILALINHTDLENVYGFLEDFKYNFWERFRNSFKARIYSKKLASVRAKVHPDTENVSLPNSPYNILKNKLISDADLIHLHWVSGFLDYPSFFENICKPVIITHHDLNPFHGLFHYQIDEKQNRHLKSLDNRLIAYKRSIIQRNNEKIWALTLSDWIEKKAKASDFYRPEQIVKIPNGLDLEFFRPANKQNSKEKLGLSYDKLAVLFCAGNLDIKRKGFEYFTDLSERMPDDCCEFIVIGETKESLPLQIKYLGNILDESKLRNIYTASDLIVVTSLEDNQPNSVIEAMACGVPVLAFGKGGIPELIDHGFNGGIVDDMSINNLVTFLTEMTTNKEKLVTMGREARIKAERNFDIRESTLKHLNLYKTVLIQ